MIEEIYALVLKEFQFLLGRLETVIASSTVGVNPMFQFLLGRLETRTGLKSRV